MLRAVIDPNVFVSAQVSSLGHPARIGRAAVDRRFEMIISEHLLAELSTVLMRARFRRCLAQSEVRKVIKDLREKGAIFEDIETERLVPDDPKDDYLIALARASGADYLVSGDPHPHGLEGANLPVVLTPRRFWELLEQKAPKKP